MLRPSTVHRVIGPPAPRRAMPSLQPEPACEHEVWLIDAAHASVAALWLDGVLWASGDRVHVIREGVAERLAPSPSAPPGVAGFGDRPWTKIVPEAGARYLLGAGAALEPDPARVDPEALLDPMLHLPPSPAPGRLAKLLGKRSPPVEAVALVLDIVDEPASSDFLAWLADLQARDVDLSWIGNESGPGLVHTIRRPRHGEPSARAALLAHARENAKLTKLVREHAEVWLEDGGGEAVRAGRLVPEDPARGWVEDLELDAIAENVVGTAGAWLDPGTAHARSAWSRVVSGSAILAALRSTVDQPTIVAVRSAPVEPVLVVHLIGGIDRTSGELVGIALQRVWT